MGGVPGFNYTPTNSDVFSQTDGSLTYSASGTSDLSQGFALAVKSGSLGTLDYRELFLSFGTRSGTNNNTANFVSLPATPGSSTTLMRSNTFNTRTSVEAGQVTGTGQIIIRGLQSNVTVNAVPWETDVLPLVVATALFAGGVWWKKSRQASAVTEILESQSEGVAQSKV